MLGFDVHDPEHREYAWDIYDYALRYPGTTPSYTALMHPQPPEGTDAYSTMHFLLCSGVLNLNYGGLHTTDKSLTSVFRQELELTPAPEPETPTLEDKIVSLLRAMRPKTLSVWSIEHALGENHSSLSPILHDMEYRGLVQCCPGQWESLYTVPIAGPAETATESPSKEESSSRGSGWPEWAPAPGLVDSRTPIVMNSNDGYLPDERVDGFQAIKDRCDAIYVDTKFPYQEKEGAVRDQIREQMAQAMEAIEEFKREWNAPVEEEDATSAWEDEAYEEYEDEYEDEEDEEEDYEIVPQTQIVNTDALKTVASSAVLGTLLLEKLQVSPMGRNMLINILRPWVEVSGVGLDATVNVKGGVLQVVQESINQSVDHWVKEKTDAAITDYCNEQDGW